MGCDLIRVAFQMALCDMENRLKGGQNGYGELRDTCSSLGETLMVQRGWRIKNGFEICLGIIINSIDVCLIGSEVSQY